MKRKKKTTGGNIFADIMPVPTYYTPNYMRRRMGGFSPSFIRSMQRIIKKHGTYRIKPIML